VCGEDGLTYAHSCVAVCQGVAVDRVGPCDSLGLALLDLSANLSSAGGPSQQSNDSRPNPMAVMGRFFLEGFK
jgi:hypothetical protein